jgi:glycosyltransferase involved in cell wall biosynthesis
MKGKKGFQKGKDNPKRILDQLLWNSMNEYDLTICIPSRNEMFLKQTIDDILKNKEAKTEIIAVLDGAWSDPAIPQHPDVNIIYVPEAIGQRAATNLGIKLSRSTWVMKVDAHCAFDKGFDRKMLEGFDKVGDDVTMVPLMRNLWAFDWKCYKCGSRWYQGPTPTRCMKQERTVVPNESCDETKNFRRKITWSVEAKTGETAQKNWKSRHSPSNASYCFDSEPHFQYMKEYSYRPEVQKMKDETGFTETMSLQGSCFMCTKEKYFDLKLCEEEHGSWGNQGIEVACKTWLSGGRVLCNHNTWYGHLFRTQGSDFNFPYRNSQSKIKETKANVWNQILNKQCPNQIYPVSWLIERFAPVPGWDNEKLAELKKTEK